MRNARPRYAHHPGIFKTYEHTVVEMTNTNYTRRVHFEVNVLYGFAVALRCGGVDVTGAGQDAMIDGACLCSRKLQHSKRGKRPEAEKAYMICRTKFDHRTQFMAIVTT